MTAFRMIATALLSGLLFAGTAVAAPSPAGTIEPAYRARLMAAADAPGDSLSAAVLVPMTRHPSMVPADGAPADAALLAASDRLLAEALAGASADWHTAAALLLSPCTTIDPADQAVLEAAMLARAPDDAFARLVAIGRAWGEERHADVAAHIAAGARATEYRSLFGPSAHALWRRLGEPETIEGGTFAIAATAFAIPAYQGLAETCRAATGDLHRDCLALLARMMRDADTLIDRTLAIELLARIGDEPLRAEATALRREHEWRLERFIDRSRALESEPAAMAGYLRQLAHGEVAAQQWLLARAGDALDPPADWVAAADRDRTPAPPALP